MSVDIAKDIGQVISKSKLLHFPKKFGIYLLPVHVKITRNCQTTPFFNKMIQKFRQAGAHFSQMHAKGINMNKTVSVHLFCTNYVNIVITGY